MSEKWRHIMRDGDCPDEPIIRDYLDGKLSSAQRFEVENHLAACEHCRDFAEGLAMLTDDQMTRHETEVKAFIHQKLALNQLSKKAYHPYNRIAIAASILLVLSLGTLLWFTAIRPSQSKLAYKEELPQPLEEPKNDLPVSEKTIIDGEQDKALEIPEPEETFIPPAPVPDKTIVIELTHEEEELPRAIAGIQVLPSHSDGSSTYAIPPTLPSLPKTTIQKIQGQVVEASTGTPLPGTVVTIKGTTTFAQTDVDGHFEIPVKDQAGILEFSFIGFDNVTIPLTDTISTPFKIEMKENLMTLDEVVVVGYGVQRKMMVTGAVTRTEKKSSSQSGKSEQAIALPELSGNEVYDTVNLLYYFLRLGDKESALSLFDILREKLEEVPQSDAIQESEQLTREDKLKRASRIIQNWLEDNNP